MNVTNTKLIAFRQIYSAIMRPAFWLGAPALPFVCLLAGYGSTLLTSNSGPVPRLQVALLNQSAFTYSPVGNHLVQYTSLSQSISVTQAADSVRSGRFDAVVYLSDTLSLDKNRLEIPLLAAKSIWWEHQQVIAQSLSTAVTDLKIAQSGIAVQLVQDAETEIHCIEQNIVNSNEKTQTTLSVVGGMLVSFFMYLLVFSTGASVMASINEERQNRIIEVIVSLVKPIDLILGKIVGCGIVGLIMFFIWLFVFTICISLFAATSGGTPPPVNTAVESPANTALTFIASKPWGIIIPLYLLYFIGGYLLYASCFAAAAAAGSGEVGQPNHAVLPLMFIAMSSAAVFPFAANNPDGMLYQFGCFFPFFTPMFMPATLLGDWHWGTIALSLLTLYGSAFLALSAAARIYRGRLMFYGKKASVKEVWRWMRY